MELIIAVFAFGFAAIFVMLSVDKTKKTEAPKIEPPKTTRKRLERPNLIDYRTISADIPEFKDNLLNTGINIRLAWFPELTAGNTLHDFLAEMIMKAVSEKLNTSILIEIDNIRTGKTGFYLEADVFFDGMPAASLLKHVPDINRFHVEGVPVVEVQKQLPGPEFAGNRYIRA